DNVRGDIVYAYANKFEFTRFLEYEYDYTILSAPSSLVKVNMISKITKEDKQNWDFYPTYQAYENMMKQFAIDYPNICSLYCIDTLPSGRLLLAVKISDNVNLDEDEPEFFYTSSIHGDELTGYVLTLRLIDYLLSNYGLDTDIKNIIDNTEIWINPLANPDGTYAGGNNTVSGATRYNANGVDLNRNYPDAANGPHPDYMSWQPETKAFMNFADSRHFVISANFHGGAEVFNYPWDVWPQLHADDNWWQLVAREYADTIHKYASSGYFTDQNNGITNGYSWYSITGGRQDYMNYFKQCREATIEISSDKIPPTSQLNSYWNYNYRSMINYLKQVNYGLRGKITDACTGAGVKANVFINSHDKDNSNVYSYLPSGQYYRPLYQGNYDVIYTAIGYEPTVIQNVNINNYSIKEQNIVLQQSQPVADFVADTLVSCTGMINFVNTSVAPSEGTIYKWDFGDGTTSTQKSPLHKYNINGIFDVKLIVITSCGYKDSIVKQNYINVNMPAAPIVTNDENCGPSVLTLGASGNGTLNWYYNIDDTLAFNVGNTYVTGLIDTTVTYYVEDVIESLPLYVGKHDNTGNGNFYSSFSQDYLLFQCYKNVELVSVKVYSGSSGIRSIYLLDAYGNIIETKDVNIPQGESRIYLNFNLPVANNLKLAGPPGANLYVNSSGVSYPYTLPGILSIVSSSSIYNPTKYYFYFYDWEIKKPPCISPRVSVNGYINYSEPIADFNYNESSFDVYFVDLSTGANNRFWDFGDGSYSNLQNPVHQYTQPGNYNVKLKVTNACGEDSITKTISITNINEHTSINNIYIYPNPASSYLNIILPSNNQLTWKYCIYDMVGRELQKGIIKNNDKNIIDIQSLKEGVYFIKIINNLYYSISKKIIIKR
ncbi:MAG TPA: M14 family zinc carboxypeptidase, partial [Bacteroidales bacterium]|nr:M14 family zinc carboxypeptidase [Bacteroidales bacterium]